MIAAKRTGWLWRAFGKAALLICTVMILGGAFERDAAAAKSPRPNIVTEQPMTIHRDGSITTPAYINRIGPFPFLVDTGAYWSAINRSTVLAYDLKYRAHGYTTLIGADGQKSARLLKFESLISSVFEIKDPVLIEIPDQNSMRFTSFRGILGSEFWAMHTVVFDLDRDKILLYPRTVDLTEGLEGYFDIVPARHDLQESAIIGVINLNGKKVSALYDTGAGASVISADIAAQFGIDPDSGRSGGLVGVHGKRIPTRIVGGNIITAGTKTWKNVHLHVSPANRLGRTKVVIGMDLIGQTPFAIDYERDRILLVKPETPVVASALLPPERQKTVRCSAIDLAVSGATCANVGFGLVPLSGEGESFGLPSPGESPVDLGSHGRALLEARELVRDAASQVVEER